MPLDIDRFAHVMSPLQRWDPRVKLASLGVLVICISLVKTVPVGVMALMSALVLVALASLPSSFILQV